MGDGILKSNDHNSSADSIDLDGSEHVFRPVEPKFNKIDLNKVDFSSFISSDNKSIRDVNTTLLESSYKNNIAIVDNIASGSSHSHINKTCEKGRVKRGEGADPSKPPCKKAKVLRLERKKEKLTQSGVNIECALKSKNEKNKDVEKSLETFLNEIPNECKHRLNVSRFSYFLYIFFYQLCKIVILLDYFGQSK